MERYPNTEGVQPVTLKLAIGADHGGYPLKIELLPWLQSEGYDVVDKGAYQLDLADDYPDFADAVATAIAAGEADRGLVICGSGVGACVAANKVRGVRACLCQDTYSAHQGVEHDDMNVLCLGARITGIELAKELITSFLNARFTGEERHKRRMAKLLEIERRGVS